MFKRKYWVAYTVRPNKSKPGAGCVTTMVLGGDMKTPREQLKVVKVLSKIHRVNPDAIELNSYELVSTEFMPLKWVKDKFIAFFSGVSL